MKHLGRKILGAAVVVIVAFLYYYITLPAINIHSSNFWIFIFAAVAVIAVVYAVKKRLGRNELKESKVIKGLGGLLLLLILVYVIGTLLSSPIVNAKKYQKLLKVEDGKFTEDIEELTFDQIPILDKESAEILGNRKMGSMSDMVSQFEVDSLYSQINYKEKPVRVTPLKYANPIKWFTNRKEGIPAYIMIDMTTQTTELVKMSEGMKYSTSEYFNRNIYRHLRFRYPTYIFDDLSFEIDDDGVPYWIAPVKKFNIGLFGGETIGRVVLCNAITGETVDYAIEDVPQWIDRAYSADLLVELYNYHGTLKHGFFNSILGQKDCLKTTEGYNFLAIDDDVWVYTGVTSITSDQSNVGFVLMNQRTMETKYYPVEGATETSAMSSAEGQVQDLKYKATFPLLLNVSGEPTYFIALKDDAGLVKKYTMVNVSKYQVVAIDDTISACEEQYHDMLAKNGIGTENGQNTADELEVSGTVTKIAQSVIDGNSHYYIMLENSQEIFDVSVAENIDIIRYDVGSQIKLKYKQGTKTNTVTEILKE